MSQLHLFKCLNAQCGLTSTIKLNDTADAGALTCSCIHCGTVHAVDHDPARTLDMAYSVTRLYTAGGGKGGNPGSEG